MFFFTWPYTQLVGLVLHVTEKASLHVYDVVLLYSYSGAFDPFICLHSRELVTSPLQGILCGFGLGDWALIE